MNEHRKNSLDGSFGLHSEMLGQNTICSGTAHADERPKFPKLGRVLEVLHADAFDTSLGRQNHRLDQPQKDFVVLVLSLAHSPSKSKENTLLAVL